MFNTSEEIIADIKAGKIIVLVDDEDRENEGDLICAAEFATPENINFMAIYAKGLICMPMDRTLTEKLVLTPMVDRNTDNHGTAFTVAIDHVETTTGISAFERSLTVMKAVEDDAKPEDFRRPGHIFPLKAVDNGVLARNGHTEATVDLARLAGLKPAGLCCEIMADDGTMMRTAELITFAKEHDLKIGTIADLIAYRKENEQLYKREGQVKLPTKYGEFDIYTYVSKIDADEHHVALVMGDVTTEEPVLVRVHSECLTGDVFGSKRCDCGQQLDAAMKQIAEAGRGVLVYLRQEGRGIGLVNKIHAYALQDQGYDTVDANLMLGFPSDLREYYMADEMLQDLGVKEIRLLTNNPLKIEGLKKHGLKVIKRIPIQLEIFGETQRYMETKKQKMGHYLDL